MSRTRILSISIFGVTVVAACLGLAPSAQAAPVPGSIVNSAAVSQTARAALSPICVTVTKEGRSKGFPYVDVKNRCSSTQRVKVIWSMGPDSSCNTLRPGESFRDSSGALAEFDGLRKC